MNGTSKSNRYTRIKRWCLAVAIAGMRCNLTTPRCAMMVRSRTGRVGGSFVEGRSTNHDRTNGHAANIAPESATSKLTIGSDSTVVSNVLQRHRTYYNNRLPHNHYVYDILQVPHNATIQQIQQSYRTLSRIYHPDKRRTRRKNLPQQQRHESDNDNEITLQRIRSAYDLLKNDTKRFLYHRHGIIHSTQEDVMSILYPRDQIHRQLLSSSSSILFYDPSAIEQLHQLMGYYRYSSPRKSDRSSLTWSESDATCDNGKEERNDDGRIDERIQNMMIFLIERIRPMIESVSVTLSDTYEHYMDQELIQQCDRIKILPLGPSILRCIGRAYRYEGKRIVRHIQFIQPPPWGGMWNDKSSKLPGDGANDAANLQYEHYPPPPLNAVAIRRRPMSQYLLVMDRVRHTMRHVKHLSTAAFAGSRVYIEERRRRQKQSQKMPHHKAGFDDDESGENSNYNQYDNEFVFDDHNDIITDSDNDRQYNSMTNGISDDVAMLESLQIDALWKVYKIELDSTVRKACRRILLSLEDPSQNVFLPSHVSDMVYNDNTCNNNIIDNNGPRYQPSSSHSRTSEKYDGWIVSDQSTNGSNAPTIPIISSSVVRRKPQQQLLVANILIRMGTIMIERSKVGTSWME